MPNYDFLTLNSSDFEEFVCDILNKENKYSKHYSTFKVGKDKGIDLLYSSEQNIYEIVGQAKHYYRTGIKGLLSLLEKEEVSKVLALNPDKYIVATSVDLGVDNKGFIKKIFNPFIKELGDIYGLKDLNRLIGEFPEILELHYKLWLSDFSIIKKILVSDLDFRSTLFSEEELKKRIRLFVETDILNHSKQILIDNKIIVITGEPGIGKTTLAEMLVYEYLGKGFKLSYVYDSSELEKAFSDDNSKQIIYFDDFLGSTKIDISDAKRGERFLTKTLRLISNNPNKFIILTTRSYLLASAKDESERLTRDFQKYINLEINLSNYTETIKKRILLNHIENSEIREDFKDLFKDSSVFNFITNHKNFSPRLIEFITNNDSIKKITDVKNYKKNIYNCLNHPQEIWKHAYKEQITDEERLLLNTLFSFGEKANLADLTDAFDKRLAYEVTNNNYHRKQNVIQNTLQRLKGNYIKIDNTNTVYFISPSLLDFLELYLLTDVNEINAIIKNIKYSQQLTGRFFSLINENVITYDFPMELEEEISSNYRSFITNFSKDQDLLRLSLIIEKYFINKEKGYAIIHDILDDIDSWESLYDNYDLNKSFTNLIDRIPTNSDIFILINSKIEDIADDLISGAYNLDDLIEQLENIEFRFNLSELNLPNLEFRLDEYFADLLYEAAEYLRDWGTDHSDLDDKKKEIEEFETKIHNLGIDYNVDYSELDDNDWSDIFTWNEIRRQMEKDD